MIKVETIDVDIPGTRKPLVAGPTVAACLRFIFAGKPSEGVASRSVFDSSRRRPAGSQRLGRDVGFAALSTHIDSRVGKGAQPEVRHSIAARDC